MMHENIKVGLFGARSNGKELGRFATEIKNALDETSNLQVVTPANNIEMPEFDVAVYASRTANQLEQAVSLCEKLNVALLVLSTDVARELQRLNPKCEIQLIPNSSTEVLYYMDEVVDFWSEHKNWEVDMTEYHQASKASISGTAVDVANKIHFPLEKIVSVRSDAKAKELFDIPDEKLSGYAVHQIKFTDPSTGESKMFEIKVIGRSTYAEGLVKIILDRLAKV